MNMPSRYRVIIDRDACIGCGVAAEVCPDVFELGEDNGKNRAREKYEAKTTDSISIGIIPESMLNCVENAADSCPVSAIRVEPS